MTTVENVVKIAKAEVGTHETRSDGHWVNDSKYNRWFGKIPGYSQDGYGYPWCAVFVAWVAAKAGVEQLFPKTASCSYGVQWYKKQNRWSDYPAVGSQVFFGAGGGTHTGLVYAYDDDFIYTVEGNTNLDGGAEGDGVYLKKRERRSSYTYGYGYPKYPEGIFSADPKWQAQNPKPVETKPKPSKPLMPRFPGKSHFVLGKRDDAVTLLGKALIKAGFNKNHDGDGYQAGPVFTKYDLANVKAFQKSLGWTGSDADGFPGPETWKRLFLKAGYRAK